MIGISTSGSTTSTEQWLQRIANPSVFDQLARFGQVGVDALAAATPLDTGETANSWYYEIVKTSHSWSIIWGNTHVEDGRPIAILIQLGHGTGTGGYVPGRDYINPALKPVFDAMEAEGFKVVNQA